MQLYLDESPESYLVHSTLGGSFKKPLGAIEENDIFFGEFDFSNVTSYPEHYVVIPFYKPVTSKCLFSKDHSPYYYLDALTKGKYSYFVTLQKKNHDYYWGNNKDINAASLFSSFLDYASLAAENTEASTLKNIIKGTSNPITNMVNTFGQRKLSYINSRLAVADITTVNKQAIMVIKADQHLTDMAYHGIEYLRIKFPSAEYYTVFVQKDNFVLAMSNNWEDVRVKLDVDSEDTWNTHAFFMDSLADKRLFKAVVSCLGGDTSGN